MRQMLQVQNLHDDDIQVPFYAYFWKNWYCYHSICRNLKSRDHWTVLQKWLDEDVSISLVASVSRIISKNMSWPNSLFVPEDSISSMTADFFGEFVSIHIWKELETKIFQTSVEYTGQLDKGTYVDFFRYSCPACFI